MRHSVCRYLFIIVIISALSYQFDNFAYAATSDGTVSSSVKIGSNTNGAPQINDGESFGGSVANIGDINSDGISDIAVGGTEFQAEDDTTGVIRIFFMKADGTVSSTKTICENNCDSNIAALADEDKFGSSVASLGDLDGAGGSVVALAGGGRI